MFADVVKSARPWYKPDHLGDTIYRAAIDANFWPTEDAGLILFDLKNSEGTYKVSFTGKASSIEIGYNSPGTIQNIVYTTATNTTTCDMMVVNSGALYLQFTGTNGGIKT